MSSPAEPLTEKAGNVDIRIVDVAKEFGDEAALYGVSLHIRAGELLALLGPSGSGKTTLLRIIAGLEVPDRGQVFFGEQDATSLPVQQRRVGFVFQHYALFRHLNVADNIAYGLRARPRGSRPAEKDIRRRVSDLLDLVQLSGYERRFPGNLSGGQCQRVALARALAVEPRVLLLDEPFGALDAKVRKDLRGWIRQLHQRTGQTTIFVTHDQDEALELADRVAILNDGRLEQVGSVDDVQDRPETPFVMAFLGDVSHFIAEVVDNQLLIQGRPVPVDPPADLSGKVRLYCRPWDLRLAPAGEGHIAGVVTGIRRVGSLRRVEVTSPADTKIEVEVPAATDLRIGQDIGLEIVRGRVTE
ncbi:sulfate/molybdate ABC transporter ATP-binding protein [Microvirga terricola]|uniref:Sulfate/molybdate ABC transporter ATP-binding protein n=1 Tax=Microvirga terricola TaxID=2719797 RepID=A0ABX0VCK3_9HYPH|nr:sulfate/molybdate ABC transporter ATP-binding protein [Microvirga terricola]NIX77574.1 sulfate/molybdate ABC transporter ATP-binding protein [Microvirga terricola]